MGTELTSTVCAVDQVKSGRTHTLVSHLQVAARVGTAAVVSEALVNVCAEESGFKDTQK